MVELSPSQRRSAMTETEGRAPLAPSPPSAVRIVRRRRPPAMGVAAERGCAPRQPCADRLQREDPGRPPHPRRLRRLLLSLLAAIPLMVLAWRACAILHGSNLDVVEHGAVYRSGQMRGPVLEERLRELGIRSVINLRGEKLGSAWYDAERDSCARLGVLHFDVPMSARLPPPPSSLTALVRLLHEAPRPLLIHCKNGADRSGLASAIALIVDESVDPRTAAARELDLWHGHVPLGPSDAMDDVLERFIDEGRGRSFAAWLEEDYAGARAPEDGG